MDYYGEEMPQTKKANPASPHKNKYVTFIVVGTLLILGAAFFWWFTYNDSLFVADKADTERKARQVLSAAQQPYAPIYESFKDEGCVTSDVGWLGQHTGCAFMGERYFKADDAPQNTLKAVDAKLHEQGFSLKSDELNPEELIMQKGGTSSTYTSKDGMVVSLRFFQNDSERATLTVRTFLHLQADVPLLANEYVYGVKVSAPYFSCSNTSWIHAPCPTPPSESIR